jgi:glycosyltransferase involved in cell wall biosynthesis
VQLIHCNEQNIYPIGQYLARILKLPVVVSVHFAMGREFCQWAFGGNRAPDKMFFVSRSNLEACRPNLDGIVAQDRWQVLHNGLNLEQYQLDAQKAFEFRNAYKLHGYRLVGVACAIRERKQIEHLYRAMAGVHVGEPVKVVLAGGEVPGEPPGYANDIVAMGKSLLGDRFVYVGHLEDLRGMLNALDLFVNTSREESFGIAPLEALACGCPVVGYDSKAVDEVVLPDGGEIVEQDNIELLRETLEKWLSDVALLSVARARARRQAERFDIRTLADQLWDEYRQLIPREIAADSLVGATV